MERNGFRPPWLIFQMFDGLFQILDGQKKGVYYTEDIRQAAAASCAVLACDTSRSFAGKRHQHCVAGLYRVDDPMFTHSRPGFGWSVPRSAHSASRKVGRSVRPTAERDHTVLGAMRGWVSPLHTQRCDTALLLRYRNTLV